MKKTVLFLMLFMLGTLLIACGHSKENASGILIAGSDQTTKNNPSADPVNQIELVGTIDGTLKIHMYLQMKDGNIEGSYYYDQYQKKILLKGNIEANRMLLLKEYDDTGTVTGTFDGWYVPGIRLTGIWLNPKTNAQLPFTLQITNGAPKDALWAGEWNRTKATPFDQSHLVIFDETKESFSFQMDAYYGGHSGYLDGTAEIAGGKASYKDATTSAELTFQLCDNLIVLTTNEQANNQAGAGVVFGGEYTKNEEMAPFTLLSANMVKTEAQEKAFLQMVGSDSALFLDSAQLCVQAEDLDDFGATVYRWWVAGLAGCYEAIIMYLPKDEFCAAAIDPATNTVKVYTNASYVQKIPKTVENWRTTFSDLEVKFINKS